MRNIADITKKTREIVAQRDVDRQARFEGESEHGVKHIGLGIDPTDRDTACGRTIPTKRHYDRISVWLYRALFNEGRTDLCQPCKLKIRRLWARSPGLRFCEGEA